MKSIYLCIFTLLCILHTVIAKKCELSIEKAKLKASSTHLRIRGRISTGSKHCNPTKHDDNDVTTTIKVEARKSVSFKDNDGVKHSGKKCTIKASWYNNPDAFSHSKKKKEVYVPFRLVNSISCDGDSKTHTKKHSTTKKSKKHSKTKKSKKHSKTKKSKKSGSSSKGYNGKATFFTPNQGACGDWNDNNDLIAAVSGELYGSYSKKSSVCGKKVQVTNKANGKSVKVTIKDACESCDKTHIDLSPAAFGKIGKFDTGILKVEWHYI